MACSNDITQTSISNVQKEIQRKLTWTPYYASNQQVQGVVTDMDVFPYTKYYRGVYDNPNPTVMDREAGFRKWCNSCYTPYIPGYYDYPNHCFEGPCSVVYPCYPDYLRKFSDADALNVMLNRTCVMKSP